jgi:hypothetical protein
VWGLEASLRITSFWGFGHRDALAFDDSYGEAVVFFAAYGLESCGFEARFGSEFFEEAACALDGWVGVIGIDDAAFADDVVGDDDCAGVREAEGPVEIVGVVRLVRVDEDEVEGWGVLGVELGERVECGADALLDE